MKVGDLVRFAKWEELTSEQVSSSRKWHLVPKNHIGVLIKHDKIMGSVQILYEDSVFSVRPVFVEKAGRRDFESR